MKYRICITVEGKERNFTDAELNQLKASKLDSIDVLKSVVKSVWQKAFNRLAVIDDATERVTIDSVEILEGFNV